MCKTFKKLTVLLLALAMILSMSVVAFAADGDSVPTAQGDNDSKLTTAGTNGTPTNSTVSGDTASINLIKNYVLAGSTEDRIKSPKESFEFTITPIGVWNAGITNIADIPLLGGDNESNVTKNTSPRNTVVVVEAGEGAAAAAGTAGNLKTAITLPDYPTVGDYWYSVVETNKQTTGVIYTTNDKASVTTGENHGHGLTYYIHVQVLNGATGLIRSVTLHKDGPTSVTADNPAYKTWFESNSYKNYSKDESVKVNDIQNEYHAGELTIAKTVDGNAGDKTHLFPVRVVFSKAAGTTVQSDIAFNAIINQADGTSADCIIKGQTNINNNTAIAASNVFSWTTDDNTAATATVTFYVMDGSTVTFSNIPYGVTYTIEEQLPENDVYTQKMAATTVNADDVNFDGAVLAKDVNNCDGDGKKREEAESSDKFGLLATGTIASANDQWQITNTKNVAIDVGVITESAPYVAILVIAFAAVVIYSRRKKNLIEE